MSEGRTADEVFCDALEVALGDRDAFVVEACGDDAALLAEVRSLLAVAESTTGFLIDDAPGAAIRAGIDDAAGRRREDGDDEGRRVGRWRLGERIGAGGMGTVYRGHRDDQEFEQEVAVKLIKRGMDTDDVLGRFRNERQVLANLEHANIAHLIDGGATDDGRPFIVMEYVDGVPIDAYCDDNRLRLRERIELFLEVCDAVEHAHRNLVIHRDIKPGNVLVTADGSPKLLDFGIARVLDDERSGIDATATGARLLTPRYASPEQVRGEVLTTSGDVYSLGVVLYELLTGRRAHVVSSRAAKELEEAICENDPTRPSSVVRQATDAGTSTHELAELRRSDPARLRKLLTGDLDTIVMKALRKTPRERYGSVREFADDLRRYLGGKPITARPSTLGYRFRKFVARNRVTVTAATIVLLAIVGGVAGVLWQANNTRIERDRAQRRYEEVRGFAHSVIFDIEYEISDLPGATKASRDLVNLALGYLDTLAQEVGDDPVLLDDLAASYERLAQIQGGQVRQNVGDLEGALASYAKAVEVRERLIQIGPDRAIAYADLAACQIGAGSVYRAQLKMSEAAAWYDKGLESMTAARRAGNESADAEYRRGSLAINIGMTYQSAGDTDAARDAFEMALEINEALFDDITAGELRDRVEYNIAVAHEKIGVVEQAEGDADAALEAQRRAFDIYAQILDRDPTDTGRRQAVGVSWVNIADVLGNPSYVNVGDVEGALAAYLEAQAIGHVLVNEDPNNARAQRIVAVSTRRAGTMSMELGRFGEAEDLFRAALEQSLEQEQRDPSDARVGLDVAACLSLLGSLERERGDLDAVLEYVSEAADRHRRVVDADPANTFQQGEFAAIRARLAMDWLSIARDATRPVQMRRDAAAESQRVASEALDSAEKLVADGTLVAYHDDLLDDLSAVIEASRIELEAIDAP